MKIIAIAVIAILFAVPSAYAEKDKFIFMHQPCYAINLSPRPRIQRIKECNAKEDALPVGSVIGFNFSNDADRTIFIGTFCKLDTVALSEQHFTHSGGFSHFRGVCEIVEKRERTSF